jgi:gliding motility-associated-like protein
MVVAGNACGNDTARVTIYADSIPKVNVVASPGDTGCHPFTVTFTNNSQGNVVSGSGVSHQWWIDGGVCCGPWWCPCCWRCPNYTTYTIPSQTFTNPSGNVPVTHTVRYVISNHCGTRDTTIRIVVHPPVVARFTQSTTTICEGGSIVFTNNSWGDSLTFIWDFGNGIVKYDTAYSPSNLPISYTITYPVAGTYVVRLIAKGYCGEDTLERTITVYPYPVAQFTLSPDSGCTPLSVSISNTSELGGSYTWTFSGGSPSSFSGYNPPTILFTSVGSHPIILSVTKNGCTSIYRDSVVVFPKPTVNFSVTPTSGCSPLTVTPTNLSPNISGYLYIWDYGNGNRDTSYTPSPQTYVNSTSSPITYTIKLIVVTDKGCRDSLSRTITVNPLPIVDFAFSPDSGCRPLTVTITNTSTTGGTYNWTFTGATPSSSTSYNPGSVTFSTPGTQYIRLTVNKFGCSNTKTDSVYVEDLPVVNFTTSPSNGCTPLNVVLTNTSPNVPGYTYIWNYGNGNVDTSYTPTSPQTYVNSGGASITYTVTLTVIAQTGCKDSLKRFITVSPLPKPNFLIVDDTICLNQSLQLTNTSTGASSYQWHFGDGNTSTQVNPTHFYTQPGDYLVKLVATSGIGCTDSISKMVHVDSIPKAGFVATTVCVGNATLFTDTSKFAIAWNWNFGDGNTSTLQNPSHLYASAGTYPVRLIVTNNKGCRDTVTQNVIVNPKPTASFTATTACYGTPTQFTDLTSGSPIGWNWNFGDGNVSTQQNPQHLYSVPGSYTVKLIVTSGIGCSDSTTQTVIVKPVPIASFSFDTVCAQDDHVTFLNTSSGGVAYQWDFGDGNTSTLMNPIHTYANGGTYSVTLIVENNVNCFDTLTQLVPVYEKPQISVNADTVCLNVASNFSYTSTLPLVQWNWDFGDLTGSTLPNPTHVYTLADTFVVTLIGTSNDGCKDTAQTLAIVNPLPTANFVSDTVCHGVPTAFTDNSIDAVAWNWDFGDGNSSTQQHPSHVYGTAGTYNATLIVFNSAGCSDTLTKPVIVHPNPVANFSADTACLHIPTTFTDNSIGAIQWYYLFGDGNTSTQANPQHIYATPDTFLAMQIVTNVYGCKDTMQRLVIVKDRPSAMFTYDPACALRPMQFYDQTIGGVTLWNWNFGDGNSSNLQNPSHIYASGGLYNVELIVGNAIGCADTVRQTIQVYTMPDPDFVADTVCVGNPTHFTNLSSDVVPMTYLWDFGDGNNSFQANPVYIYGAPGTYQVTLIVTNQYGCDTFITKPVIVSPVPRADFEVDTACFGTPSTFVSTTTGIVTQYIWRFGDGTSDTTTSSTIQHQYPAPGTYFVTLTVKNGDCVDGIAKPAIVVDSINAEFIASNQLICPGDAVDFIDLSSGNPTQWEWNMGDGNLLNSQHVSQYVYPNAGTYTVILTARNQHCVDQDSFTLYVSTAPTSLFSFHDTCVHLPVVFANQSNPGLFQVQYIWDFGDGTRDTAFSPTHIYHQPGTYTVRLILDNGRCPDTLTQTLHIHPQPSLSIQIRDTLTRVWRTVEFQNQSPSLLTRLFWDIGDGTTSTLPYFTHVYNDTGTYPVIFIGEDANGCRDTLYSKVVVQGEFTIFAPTAFSPNGDGINDEFFPNGIFFDVQKFELTIYDRWGNIVYQTTGFEPWDGRDQRTGKPVPEDAYVFVIKGIDFRKQPIELIGTVTVIR